MTRKQVGRVRRTRRKFRGGGFGETALPLRTISEDLAAFPQGDLRVITYPRLRSTQSKAVELLETGRAKAPFAIVAARQTAGRGQRANRWWSDAGSLCATFVLPAADLPPGQIPLRAGLAVSEWIARIARRATICVKWPNDVLANGKKIAGVLCERRGGCDVIGIGLNLSVDFQRAPADVRQVATSLSQLGVLAPNRGETLRELWLDLCQTFARDDFGTAYESRVLHLQKSIRVQTDEGELEAMCVGFDPEGCLLAQTGSEILRITESDRIIAGGAAAQKFPARRRTARAAASRE